jgi:nucleoside-diphosphate-sugar epimerase
MVIGIKKPRALVTGDRGFLGRHFSARLRDLGYDVTGMDTSVTTSQDCRDLFRMERRHPALTALNGAWDLVVHCAAVVGGRKVIERSPLENAESLAIDAEMFRWAAVVKPRRVLYLSSSAVYPADLQRDDEFGRLHEELVDPGSGYFHTPDEIYGWSKLMGEVLAGRLRDAGVPVTVVRPFSGYGGDQSADYPFRAILERAKAHEDPLTVWCGACVRDWIHVEDLVEGALAAVHDGLQTPVNLCTGRATPFWELAGLMAQAVGYEPAVHGLADEPQGVMYRVGDPERMRAVYQPQVTLEEGIRRALEV